jgi:hypothetical protein
MSSHHDEPGTDDDRGAAGHGHRRDHSASGRGRSIRRYVGDFVSNWSTSDAPFATRLSMTIRNRARAFSPPFRGCCGHPGDPGC